MQMEEPILQTGGDSPFPQPQQPFLFAAFVCFRSTSEIRSIAKESHKTFPVFGAVEDGRIE